MPLEADYNVITPDYLDLHGTKLKYRLISENQEAIDIQNCTLSQRAMIRYDSVNFKCIKENK